MIEQNDIHLVKSFDEMQGMAGMVKMINAEKTGGLRQRYGFWGFGNRGQPHPQFSLIWIVV